MFPVHWWDFLGKPKKPKNLKPQSKNMDLRGGGVNMLEKEQSEINRENWAAGIWIIQKR